MQEKNVAIFLNTCDKNQDVCKYFLFAFDKYWADCRFLKFAGVNSHDEEVKSFGFIPVKAEKKNWREETIYQLNLIKNNYPNITHLIFLLDDFILEKKVDNEKLSHLIEHTKTYNSSYIRLKRIEEGFLFLIYNYFKKKKIWGDVDGLKIRKTHPYYSALQIAIWDIVYLTDCIERCQDIWNFETLKTYHQCHYSVYKNLIEYRHIVEKGNWDVDIERYCMKTIGFFSYGTRPKRELSLFSKLKFYYRKQIFFLFGYSILKLKLFINEKLLHK